jgi:hypothetical protein
MKDGFIWLTTTINYSNDNAPSVPVLITAATLYTAYNRSDCLKTVTILAATASASPLVTSLEWWTKWLVQTQLCCTFSALHLSRELCSCCLHTMHLLCSYTATQPISCSPFPALRLLLQTATPSAAACAFCDECDVFLYLLYRNTTSQLRVSPIIYLMHVWGPTTSHNTLNYKELAAAGGVRT